MKRIVDVSLIALFIIGILLSIITYFDALSQYPTADQLNTYSRIEFFLKYGYSGVYDGSCVSFVLIGKLGKILESYLLQHFKPQEVVIGSIHLTTFLPYAFWQVVFSILMLTVFVVTMGKILNWDKKKDLVLYLFSALVILNLPLVKAICKILKYDALSLCLSLLAVNFYLLFLKIKTEKYYFLTVFFSVLAFHEKSSTFSVALLLVFAEGIRLVLFEPVFNVKRLFLRISLTLLASILIGFTFIPFFWIRPKESIKAFYYVHEYIDGFSFLLVPFGIATILLIVKFRIKIREVAVSLITNLKVIRICKWVPLFLIVFAALYQSNEAWLPEYLPLEKQFKLLSEGLFISNPVGKSIVTTMDKSAFVTRVKIFFMNIRMFTYLLPEVVLILLLIPLASIFRKTKSVKTDKIFVVKVFLFLFILLYLICFSYGLAPVDGKYVNVLFVLASFLGLTYFTDWWRLNNKYFLKSRGALLFCALLLLGPAINASPSYFGWINVLRNKEVENRESLIRGNSGWIWMGWGESAYAIQIWMQKQGLIQGATKVLFDYGPIGKLYYDSPNLEFISTDSLYLFINDNVTLKDWALRKKEQGVKFLVVNKTMAYREDGPSFIIKHFRSRAIFTEERVGIEYAWLFRIEDFVNL